MRVRTASPLLHAKLWNPSGSDTPPADILYDGAAVGNRMDHNTIAWTIIVIAMFAAFLFLVRRGARRFEARRRAAGEWDDWGPRHPTEAPPHQIQGGNMSWLLEQYGGWRGKPLPRPPYDGIKRDRSE